MEESSPDMGDYEMDEYEADPDQNQETQKKDEEDEYSGVFE